jgi:hypothetical protein
VLTATNLTSELVRTVESITTSRRLSPTSPASWFEQSTTSVASPRGSFPLHASKLTCSDESSSWPGLSSTHPPFPAALRPKASCDGLQRLLGEPSKDLRSPATASGFRLSYRFYLAATASESERRPFEKDYAKSDTQSSNRIWKKISKNLCRSQLYRASSGSYNLLKKFVFYDLFCRNFFQADRPFGRFASDSNVM